MFKTVNESVIIFIALSMQVLRAFIRKTLKNHIKDLNLKIASPPIPTKRSTHTLQYCIGTLIRMHRVTVPSASGTKQLNIRTRLLSSSLWFRAAFILPS